MRKRLYLFTLTSVLLPVGSASAQRLSDHGEDRPESRREIPDLVLSAVGPGEKPAADGEKGADGAESDTSTA